MTNVKNTKRTFSVADYPPGHTSDCIHAVLPSCRVFVLWNSGGAHAREVIRLQFVQKGGGELSES